MKTKIQNWFKLAFQLRGSVILAIYQRVIGFGIFSFIVSVLYYLKLPVSQPILGSIIPSIVLGLLLVFRTNTAYERFWEGRDLPLDDICNTIKYDIEEFITCHPQLKSNSDKI